MKEEEYNKLESQYGLFNRTFTLPQRVESSNISAKFIDGILEVVIPKLAVDTSSIKIDIK